MPGPDGQHTPGEMIFQQVSGLSLIRTYVG